MATKDMTDALKHPHPDVPFATIGDDTITALSQLATIFKNKLSTQFYSKNTTPVVFSTQQKDMRGLILHHANSFQVL
jgi:hypothetical protein